MIRKTAVFLFLIAIASLPATVMAGSAAVTVTVVDDGGSSIPGALFVFSLEGDPTQSFSIGENDAGQYRDTVKLPVDDANWNLTKSVALGYLPVRATLESRTGGGEVIQESRDVEVNPGLPVPPIRIVAGGSVKIELTMGDQGSVMRSFLAARKKAKAEADAKRAAEPQDGPQGAYAEALRLYGEGKLDESLPRFEQAVEEDPENLELRVTYANVLYKAKQYEPFEQAALAALELAPGNRDLLMMLYSSRRGRGDLEGALETLLTLEESGAAGADLEQHLDFVAKKMGRSRKAVPAYEAILQIDPANVDAYLSLASIYATSDAQPVELLPGEGGGVGPGTRREDLLRPGLGTPRRREGERPRCGDDPEDDRTRPGHGHGVQEARPRALAA